MLSRKWYQQMCTQIQCLPDLANFVVYYIIYAYVRPLCWSVMTCILLVSLAESLTHIYIWIVLQKTGAANIVYNQLMQELTRRSTYFCEKACANGLILLLLANVQHFAIIVGTEVSRCKIAFWICSFSWVFIINTVLSKNSICDIDRIYM